MEFSANLAIFCVLLVAVVAEQDEHSKNEIPPLTENSLGGDFACDPGLSRDVDICQNYKTAIEDAINQQINDEFNAGYYYHSLASYFRRHDVALMAMAEYFKENSDEEREHADKLMNYQTQRGGRVTLKSINVPPAFTGKQSHGTEIEAALRSALLKEKDINSKLLALHKLAQDNNDPHLQDFLESEYLDEQVKHIKELGDMITQVKRMTKHHSSNGLGEQLFDNWLAEKRKK